jgi:nitric oxide reductase large subunit
MMMAEKPPFDPIRACFWLIAAVLAVQCVTVLMAVGACLYWSGAVIEGKWTCENINATLNQLPVARWLRHWLSLPVSRGRINDADKAPEPSLYLG